MLSRLTVNEKLSLDLKSDISLTYFYFRQR